jgi:HemY protein
VKHAAILLGAVFLAMLVTLGAVKDPGYVLISRMPWSIEMSLTVFVPLLLLAFCLFALLVFLLVRLVRIPRDVERWRLKRQQRAGRAALVKGFTHLAECNWLQAETEFLAGLRFSDAPLLHCLGCAYAAHGQGQIEKRDEYLAQAQQYAPHNNLAIGVSQAFLQHMARQPELSLATLTELKQKLPRHPQVLKLLSQVYLDLRDWPALVELIENLRETDALPAADVNALELQAHRELLQLSLPVGSREVLAQAWKNVPKTLRQQPALIAIYARQLMQQGAAEEAGSVLRQALDNEWDEALAETYGRLRPEHPADALAAAQTWATQHPESIAAQLAAARLSLKAGRQAEAKNYYEKCLALRAPAVAYREFGQLLEDLGEKDQALTAYRKGLEIHADETRNSARARLTAVRRALR